MSGGGGGSFGWLVGTDSFGGSFDGEIQVSGAGGGGGIGGGGGGAGIFSGTGLGFFNADLVGEAEWCGAFSTFGFSFFDASVGLFFGTDMANTV